MDTLLAESRYLARHALAPAQIAESPQPSLGLVVVIPALAEPALVDTLESLGCCEPAGCAVEILVVINGAEDSPAAVQRANAKSLEEVRRWASSNDTAMFRTHALYFPRLAPRTAGVGLARKLGLDEAVRRLTCAGNPAGVLACLDADCTVSIEYLRALERHFERNPGSDACTLPFEHNLEHTASAGEREGIATYELSLRYVVQGLRYSGHPGALHTIGSCMAVRGGAYQAQGGMNRRKGAEDFYFLNKFMRVGRVTECEAGCVYPSARISGRVPFGTGAAMAEWSGGTGVPERLVYAPETFRDLRSFLQGVDGLYAASARKSAPALNSTLPASWETSLEELPPPLRAWLDHAAFAHRIQEINRNSASLAGFRSRFFQWFDRFRVMKCAHYLRDHGYAQQPVVVAARHLLTMSGVAVPPEESGAEGLLHRMRALQQPSPETDT